MFLRVTTALLMFLRVMLTLLMFLDGFNVCYMHLIDVNNFTVTLSHLR